MVGRGLGSAGVYSGSERALHRQCTVSISRPDCPQPPAHAHPDSDITPSSPPPRTHDHDTTSQHSSLTMSATMATASSAISTLYRIAVYLFLEAVCLRLSLHPTPVLTTPIL